LAAAARAAAGRGSPGSRAGPLTRWCRALDGRGRPAADRRRSAAPGDRAVEPPAAAGGAAPLLHRAAAVLCTDRRIPATERRGYWAAAQALPGAALWLSDGGGFWSAAGGNLLTSHEHPDPETLLAWIEGRLAGRDARRVKEHLEAGCPAC